MLSQDLHIHTTYSASDNYVVPQQTVSLLASVKHARIIGISDNFENLINGRFEPYFAEVSGNGLKVGVEIEGHRWARLASEHKVDYYVMHCRDNSADYGAVELLFSTGRPVVIAHPNILGTDLGRLSRECLIEINNRYVWRNDWRTYYTPFVDRFRFVISSDAHQPNWLGQTMARYVAEELGVTEHIVFST
jgi:hypothetical protein